MNFTVLGKYGPFAIGGEKSTSSYLVESDNQACVLDLGSGSVSKLLQKISLDKLKFVFLSHMHFDHVCDFGVLSYAISFLNKGEKINLYAYNDGSDLFNLIKSNQAFNVIELEVGREYTDGNFTFSFYKMVHPAVSHGIKITSSGKTLAYTGDTTILGDIMLSSLWRKGIICSISFEVGVRFETVPFGETFVGRNFTAFVM